MRTNTFDPKSFHCCGSVYFCFFVEICGPEPPILTCFLDEVVESLLSKVINELEHRIASQSELVKETMDTNGCNSVLRMESPCNTNDSKSLSRVDPPQVELTSCSDLEKVKETMDTNGCNSVLRMESPCNTNDSKSLSRVDPPQVELTSCSDLEKVKETMDTNGCNSVLRMESPCNTNDSKSLSRVDPPQVELTSCSDLEKVTRETSRYEPTTPTSNREMPPAAFHQRRELLSYEQLCCLDDVNFANAVIFGNKSCYCYQTLNLVLVTVFNLKIQKYSSITWNHSFSWVPNASNASCLIKLILQ
ncbi:uncharacterized protein [Zea mays]|uniref:uncharacterized protein LOC100382526 isoform 2 n=1 Tax=Zea mays TaxID=4577 RepID=UPI0009AACF47|nr:uncharacterized protein LOC100382526 isoform 2 [Zea mays]XP_020400741.1 uncharacterized protein LOC100382526 isoform X4 [Zea mays]|eukprot:XP_020400741.1 uncharacterized protein LOC100382526 isoform X6 [Zea mays]